MKMEKKVGPDNTWTYYAPWTLYSRQEAAKKCSTLWNHKICDFAFWKYYSNQSEKNRLDESQSRKREELGDLAVEYLKDGDSMG